MDNYQPAKVGGMNAGLGENITLKVEAEVDGEKVLEKEGDSLTWGFVGFLHAHMRGFNAQVPRVYIGNRGSSGIYLSGFVSGSDPFRFNWDTESSLDGNYTDWDQYGNNSQDFIYLTGHPDIENKPFFIANHSGFNSHTGWMELNEARFNPSTMAWEDTGVAFMPTNPSTFSLEGGIRDRRILSAHVRSENRHRNRLTNVDLLVGKGNDPIDLSNVGNNHFRQTGFSYDSQGRPAPVINTNDANLKWSRTVTNNTGVDQTLNEIFLSQDGKVIAKDAINVTVPNGSTATFYYSIVVDNSAGGGVMAQFLEILYRRTNTVARECPDIFNTNRSRYHSWWDFCLSHGTPGQTVRPDGAGRNRTKDIGLMVGTGTNTVANTNTALDARIPHGDGPGELHYYGMFITAMTVDEVNGRVYFRAERVFENKTSADITINEVGLYAGAADGQYANYAYEAVDYTDDDYLGDQHLITRNVLSTPITITAGSLKKLYYEIGIKI